MLVAVDCSVSRKLDLDEGLAGLVGFAGLTSDSSGARLDVGAFLGETEGSVLTGFDPNTRLCGEAGSLFAGRCF